MAADETRRQRVEFLVTVLLAVAAVATAWSTYQSARWRGEQAAESSKATAAHIASSEASTRAGQLTQIDIATFVQWVDADVAGDGALARFYRRRFRKEFRPAFAAWVATSPRTNPTAPLSPFAMWQYRVAEAVQAERLNTAAGARADAAAEANERSGNYVLAVGCSPSRSSSPGWRQSFARCGARRCSWRWDGWSSLAPPPGWRPFPSRSSLA